MFKATNKQTLSVQDFCQMVKFLSVFVPSKAKVDEHLCIRFIGNMAYAGNDDLSAIYVNKNYTFCENKMTIRAKVMLNLFNKFPDDAIIHFDINHEANCLTVSCNNYKGTFEIIPTEENIVIEKPKNIINIETSLLDGMLFLANSRAKGVQATSRSLFMGAYLKGEYGYSTNMSAFSKYKFAQNFGDVVIHHNLLDAIKKVKKNPTGLGVTDDFIYLYYGGDRGVVRCRRYPKDIEQYSSIYLQLANSENIESTFGIKINPIVIILALERVKASSNSKEAPAIKMTLVSDRVICFEHFEGITKELVDCEGVSGNFVKSVSTTSSYENYHNLFTAYKEYKDIFVYFKENRVYISEAENNPVMFSVISCK